MMGWKWPSLLLILIFLADNVFSQEEALETKNKTDASKQKLAEPEESLGEFEQIKSIIKNDHLEQEVAKMNDIKSKQEQEKIQQIKNLYNFPTENDFWTFASELWLVKRAGQLKWDFERPDYGLEETVKNLFEEMGYFEQKIKILIANVPDLAHLALPANDGELIFIISLPFMRTLDLNKLEIALLVLENFFRHKQSHFKKYVLDQEFAANFNQNFYQKDWDAKQIEKILANYDFFIKKKGFTFQQQYETTKMMGQVLMTNVKLWQIYLDLLGKIDVLVKNNVLYSYYNSIYPSPEMQLKWLKPGL